MFYLREIGRFGWLGLVLSVSVSAFLPAQEAPASDTAASNTAANASDELFVTKVRPLLQAKCWGCHGAGDTLEGQFDMRSRKGLLAGGESEEPALVPGNAAKSKLFLAVTWEDDTLQMPPKQRNRLSETEVKLMRQWIDAGAPWPETDDARWTAGDGIRIPTSGGLSPDWTNRRYEPDAVWAYQPITRPAVPKLEHSESDNPIDAFIAARLADADLQSAEPADRRTWLRRATFDLTGLPPTEEALRAFLADARSDARRRAIDRLLATNAYGEQAARHWLDVVRYADTSGYSNDYERPNAWRYRDYVIRSFNADKPFDRFIVEQIAGDELEPDNPEMRIAVGYLRMGPWEHTGMSVAAVTRQLFLDDVTNSVGVTFLGQGLRCASCHDHKFDPVPTRDYYRIQAVFAPVQFAHREAPFLPEENTSSFARTRPRVEAKLRHTRSLLSALEKKNRQAVDAYLKKRGVERINDLPVDERSNSQFFGLTELEKSLRKICRKRIAYFERELVRYRPLAHSVYNGPLQVVNSNQPVTSMRQASGKPPQTFILLGGSVATPGDTVPPGVLSAARFRGAALRSTDSDPALADIPVESFGRRLALARWIAEDRNPLTARVIVNRIWAQHFAGKGLVATPNNFGKMGARPTHPELLDWLATWLIEHDWSIKGLHRLIMTSETYAQSARPVDARQVTERDAGNDLLSYYPPRRLAAEEIRDAMLVATGEMNREMGGPGNYPEINWEVALQPRHIMGSVAPAYQPSPTPAERHRRAIYAFRYRTLPDPMLEVLNKPGSETSCARRDSTTVTPQAFALLNSQFVHNRALALAARLEQTSDKLDEQIDAAFRLTLSREPTAAERARCRTHVQTMREHHRNQPPARVELPQVVEREMIEELTGDRFTWKEELDQMKHYQPDLQPADVGPQTRALAQLCLVLLNSNEFIYVY